MSVAGEGLAPGAHETPKVLGAAMVLGTSALMVLGVQPILLGGLIREGRITEAGLGQVAMAEVFCLAIGSLIGPSLMNRGSMRRRAVVVAVLLALANGATGLSSSPLQLIGMRAMAGLLEGLALGAAVLVLTHTRHPHRMSGLFLGLQTVPQAIAALTFPSLLIPRFGVDSGFLVLGGLAAGGAGAALLLVDHVATPSTTSRIRIAWTPQLLWLILAILLQNASIGAAWSYVERLAEHHGLSPSTIGLSLSGSLLFQVAGALVVAWVAWRLPHRASLMIGSMLQAIVALLMLIADTPFAFFAATCLFGLFWLALQPFQVSYAIECDPSRSVAVLLTPIALVGFSTGPLIVSALVVGQTVTPAYIAAAGLLVLACACYALAGTRRSLHHEGVATGRPVM